MFSGSHAKSWQYKCPCSKNNTKVQQWAPGKNCLGLSTNSLGTKYVLSFVSPHDIACNRPGISTRYSDIVDLWSGEVYLGVSSVLSLLPGFLLLSGLAGRMMRRLRVRRSSPPVPGPPDDRPGGLYRGSWEDVYRLSRD